MNDNTTLLEDIQAHLSVWEDEKFVAFLMINPPEDREGSVVVVNKNYLDFRDTTSDEKDIKDVLEAGEKVADALVRSMGWKSAEMCVVGDGADALHVRIYPVFNGIASTSGTQIKNILKNDSSLFPLDGVGLSDNKIMELRRKATGAEK